MVRRRTFATSSLPMTDSCHPRSALVRLGAVIMVAVAVTGCQAIREVANLRKVDFAIDRVTNAELAGVDVSSVQNYSDLGARDMLRLSAAIAEGRMPLSFTLHLNARNPADNDVNARLTQMDWTLVLEDRDTISGTFDQETVLRPGEPRDVPIALTVDLVDFFDNNLRDLVNVALAAGGNGPPANVKLRARPTVQTKIGPIRYPSAITIVSRDVGRSGDAP